MYSTVRSFFNTILGIIGTFLSSVFQFVLIYLIINYYGAKINGLIRTIMAVTFTIGVAESSLGIMGITYLYRPLAKGDWLTVNDIVGTIRNNYIKTGLIYLLLVIFLGLGFSLYAFWGNISEINVVSNDKSVINVKVPFWQLWIIVLSLSLKNLLSFFFVGAYENLLQADNDNYFNRIIHFTCDLIVFTGVVSLMLYLAINEYQHIYLPFLFYIFHGIIKSILIYIYVKLKYPWLYLKKWTKNEKLLKDSNYVAIKGLAVSIFNNIDFVLIAVLIGFRAASAYSIYLIVTLNLRIIMLLFITSFKDFFGTWISHQGRIRWNTYVKFELFTYMIAAFMFITQFIMTPYFVNGLFGKLKDQILAYVESSSNVTFENEIINIIFNSPNLALMFAINSAILMISEPASILIYGGARYRETAKYDYIQLGITLFLNIIFMPVFIYIIEDAQLTLYALVLSTTFGLIFRWIYSSSYAWNYLTYNSNARFWWKNLTIIILPIVLSIWIAYKWIFPNPIYQFSNYELLSKQLGLKGILWLLFLIVVISVPIIIFLAAVIEPIELMAILSRSFLTKWIVVRVKKIFKIKEDISEEDKDELEIFNDSSKIKNYTWEIEKQRQNKLTSVSKKQEIYVLSNKGENYGKSKI